MTTICAPDVFEQQQCTRNTLYIEKHLLMSGNLPHVPRRNAQLSQRRRLQQASSASSSLVRQIQQIQQYREFNSDDYELLLRLDEENRRQQRRLNALTDTNDLYQDNSSIRIPLAVYLVQCIKACYTTFNTRTRANLNYNLKNMTSSSTCVQCNGRMSGTDNPIRLICGDWVHSECVENLISSSMVHLTNSNSRDSNENTNESKPTRAAQSVSNVCTLT